MLKCVISGDRYYSGLTREQVEDLKVALRLDNPDYTALIKYSKSPPWVLEKQLARTPRLLSFWDEPKQGVYQVPRGYILPDAKEVANVNCSPAEFPPLQVVPRDWQGDALKVFDNITATEVYDTTIQAPPGSGKTVFGALAMARLGVRTLVLVHKSNILDAWVHDLKLAFGKDFVPAVIKGAKKQVGETVTIAMMQTIRNMDPKDYNVFGLVIIDESHHCPSSTYLDILCNTESKYRLGLTATPKRADGLDQLIEWSCGPIRFKAEKDKKNTVPLNINAVMTGIEITQEDRLPYTKLINLQSKEPARLAFIGDLAQAVLEKYKQPVLIVTMRVSHSEKLQDILNNLGIDSVSISAKTKPAERDVIYDKIRNGDVPVTVATSLMLAEGVNVPIWGHLILANSLNDETLVRQVIGRVERAHKTKTHGYVWDLVDRDSFARAMYFNRANKVYVNVTGEIKKVKLTADGKLVTPKPKHKKKKKSIIKPIKSRRA